MITIKPENPSSDDNVEFEFSVPCSSFGEMSKKVIGSQFVLNVDVPTPCPIVSTPPGPFPVFWSVGRLESGDYQVVFSQSWVTGSATEISSQTFFVSQGELPFPEPAIPSTGVVGAFVLAIALVWIANKALKRTPKGAA